MSTRVVIAYLLMFLLIAGVGVVLWHTVHYSERNIRRRSRRARRDRIKQAGELTADDDGSSAEET